MEEKIIQNPAVSPDDRNLQVDSGPENGRVHTLFYGLDLLRPDLAEQLKNFISPPEIGKPDKPTGPPDDRFLHIDKPENEPVHGLFSGLGLLKPDVLEQLKNFNSPKQPNQTRNVVTVGQYLDDWVADNYPDPKTAEGRTRAGYEGYIRDYIKSQLGGIQLTELTPHQTRHFVNWLKKEARSPKTKGPLSQTT